MAFATVAEVKERVAFDEINEMAEVKVADLIERAERWIRIFAGRNFAEETDPITLGDLRRAVVLLVEYLWFQDQPDMKEEAFDNVQSEKIGSYSYTKNAKPGESTGVAELDQILYSLRPSAALKPLFFSTFGAGGGTR
ncbi:head-tail connector protein [Planococcus wigleyi]|uniref:DUF3199 family protein n=1 Tax=Planococcus wigleyi TaxID=2762216 RepID=A0ABR8WAT5_9BACL|nr:DUF3199 family protein [Planococcus wigleyi]MBD8013886.1 DUF3199 family protein [Planococcus wigleyi]